MEFLKSIELYFFSNDLTNKYRSIISQFTTLNVRAVERALQHRLLHSFQHLFTSAPHNFVYCDVHLPLPSPKGTYDDVVLLHFVPRLISNPELLSTKPMARSGQIRFVHVSLLPVRNVTGDERAHVRNKSSKSRSFFDEFNTAVKFFLINVVISAS